MSRHLLSQQSESGEVVPDDKEGAPSMALAEVEVLAPEPTLDELVATIHREHQLAHQAGMAMVAHAIRAGGALMECRRLVPHGQWCAWLETTFPDKHPKTLRFYMRVAKYRETVEAANPPTLTAAHRLLAGEAIRPHDDELKAEARRLKQEGLTYAAIAARLGASQDAVSIWLNPRRADRRRRRRQAESREARRALHRERRDRAARRAGGGLAESYSLIRKAHQALEIATAEEGDQEAKKAIGLAIERLYAAEDLVSRAVRVHRHATGTRNEKVARDVA